MTNPRLRVLATPIAYNEDKKIGSVITRFQGVKSVDELMILDDASTDRTAEIAREMGVKVFTQKRHQGVGAAIRTAIRYARENGFGILVILAGNDKDRPDEIGRLVDPIQAGECDFVQGSRYLRGGQFGNMPVYRTLSTRWLHPFLFSMAAGRRITDSTNGFRAIRLSVLEDKRIDLDQDWLNEYELEPYLFYKLIRLGYRVREVPVTKIYPPKQLGYTKMRPITGWWSILRPIFLLGFGIKK